MKAPDRYKTYKGVDGETHTAGIVYMYADNAEFEVKDRIHHDKKRDRNHSTHGIQRLIINDGSEETENPDLPWNVNDFTFEGQTVTGLSESGIAKEQRIRSGYPGFYQGRHVCDCNRRCKSWWKRTFCFKRRRL